MSTSDEIVRIVLTHYPSSQAIYLFGSYGTPDEWKDSDVDVAVLLPPGEAREQGQLMLTSCHYALAEALGKSVDLVNAREVSTVFQKELIGFGRRLHAANEEAAAEFEMLTLSYYQKLNEERAAILADALAGGRFYEV